MCRKLGMLHLNRAVLVVEARLETLEAPETRDPSVLESRWVAARPRPCIPLCVRELKREKNRAYLYF